MLRVLFFARIKEELGMSFFDLNVNFPTSKLEVRELLSAQFNSHKNLFSEDYAIVAINQEISDKNSEIKKDDEVAFFPPVTGG